MSKQTRRQTLTQASNCVVFEVSKPPGPIFIQANCTAVDGAFGFFGSSVKPPDLSDVVAVSNWLTNECSIIDDSVYSATGKQYKSLSHAPKWIGGFQLGNTSFSAEFIVVF